MSDSTLRPMRPIKRTPLAEEVLPIQSLDVAQQPTKPTTPPVHKPCAGLGLDTPENKQAFVQEFRKLRKEWPSITGRLEPRPEALGRRIEQLVNAQLQKVGVPPVSAVPGFLTDNVQGQFRPSTWEMKISREILKPQSLSDAQAGDLAAAIYHESRHAEQTYLVSRLRAAVLGAKGTTAEQVLEISRNSPSNVPPRIAAYARQHPLGVQDPLTPCAQLLASQNDFTNPAFGHTIDTYAALPGLDRKLNQAADGLYSAKQEYTQTQQNRHASVDMVQRAKGRLESAQKRLQAATEAKRLGYDAYRNLPNEADAFETEAAVGAAAGKEH